MFDRYDAGEQAVLVHIYFTQDKDMEDLQEFESLVSSAGVEALQVITGSRKAPHPKYFVGEGKAVEIAEAVKATGASVVLFDHALSPAQERNLERLCECRVIDRTGLILDIFAQRARTQEGKLQVELAQLKYLLPRLGGQGTALMQQKGGIGLRGPGETKLEYDKRRLRLRISKLEKEIEQVKKERGLRRERRTQIPLPQIAIVGYTNAGKSTLLNVLTRQNAVYADDKLFATLDPTTRRVHMPAGGEMLFTDTVGFIQKLPHSLVSSFRATLEETSFADVILHVHDASSPHRNTQAETVRQIITDLGAQTIPVIDVFNKIDLLSPARLALLQAQNPQGSFISAGNKRGLTELLEQVEENVARRWKLRRLTLEPKARGLIGFIYGKALVNGQKELPSGALELTLMATDGNYHSILKKLTSF